jgi:hypothetical protein
VAKGAPVRAVAREGGLLERDEAIEVAGPAKARFGAVHATSAHVESAVQR